MSLLLNDLKQRTVTASGDCWQISRYWFGTTPTYAPEGDESKRLHRYQNTVILGTRTKIVWLNI